jgi:transcriptional antiterminator RfaH
MSASDESNSLRWYVVQTKPKQEARAESNFRRWGLETLAPRMKESRIRRSSQGLVYREAPLFPSYIFARFNAAVLVSKVRLTRGVHKVVGFGEYATPIDDSVIALIRSRIGDDGFVRIAEPRPGDVVQVVDGPMRSLVGVFERELRAQDRVLILVNTIACQLHLQIAKPLIRTIVTEMTA